MIAAFDIVGERLVGDEVDRAVSSSCVGPHPDDVATAVDGCAVDHHALTELGVLGS